MFSDNNVSKNRKKQELNENLLCAEARSLQRVKERVTKRISQREKGKEREGERESESGVNVRAGVALGWRTIDVIVFWGHDVFENKRQNTPKTEIRQEEKSIYDGGNDRTANTLT